MVYEQGEVIDSIEAHVEKTEIFVSEGTGQLRQASQYQVSSMVLFFAQLILMFFSCFKSKARMKKFIFFSCLAIVMAVIVAYIIYELSN
jgi:t-SNARE complex subunit (syntaxin)